VDHENWRLTNAVSPLAHAGPTWIERNAAEKILSAYRIWIAEDGILLMLGEHVGNNMLNCA
jgi:hypothetical protein